jgi:hypothetical protein
MSILNPKLKALQADLAAAKAAADAAVVGIDDNGSCNFDSVLVRVGPNSPFPKKTKLLEEVMTAAGGNWQVVQYRGRGWDFNSPVGQGAKRTKWAEVFERYLKFSGRGYDVTILHVLD